MTTLKFADTHNMVAFLSKPEESDGFEQIVDFLNAHPIKYALTVNPIIYTSCIEQFWSTVKAKMVNGEVQLQALVDGKKIIVTEASVRSDLQLDDEEGMDCLPNATIFEELTRMSHSDKKINNDMVTDVRSMSEDYEIASKINRTAGEVNNVVVENDQFLDELHSLGVRPVPTKMAEFLKEIQMKDRETVAELQILEREMELNARKKDLFIQKLNGLIPY
ncbi:hypothetical protein Tco_1465362 [Tanacetum coccineum]